MSSVTKRISEVKQPYGGYLRPSLFQSIQYEDYKVLSAEENLHPSVIGLVVDYMSRFLLNGSIMDAFRISIEGAKCAAVLGQSGSLKELSDYLYKVRDLSDESITNACKCVTFDVWLRNPTVAFTATTAANTNPDQATINNIRTMVQRSQVFFREYGPVIEDGFGFLPNGYTETVDSGDGDFLTADTMWDFKVSKNKLTSKQTLQLLMYWIMGQHSGQDVFRDIRRLGFYNPRQNVVQLLDVGQIPTETIRAVERDVICY